MRRGEPCRGTFCKVAGPGPAALLPVPAVTRPQPAGRDGVGRGRGGRERGSGQPVPGPPGEAAGYFYPVVFAECAADLPSGARKFPPSASFPFPPFPRARRGSGGRGTADRGGGGWGAEAVTPGGAAARAGGSGDGEQVSEPSLIAGPVGGARGADGEGEERCHAGTPSAAGRGAPAPESRGGARGSRGAGQRRARRRPRAANELSRGSGGRGTGAAACLGAGAVSAWLCGRQLVRQTLRGGLRPEAAPNHGRFDRSTRALLLFRVGKVKLLRSCTSTFCVPPPVRAALHSGSWQPAPWKSSRLSQNFIDEFISSIDLLTVSVI